MQTQNRFFDDLAHLLGGAAGTLSGIRNEIEGLFRHQFERLLSNTELVSRDEFEILYTLTQTARESQENLEKRLAALETRSSVSVFNLNRRTSFLRRPLSRRRAVVNLRKAAQRHIKKKPKETSTCDK